MTQGLTTLETLTDTTIDSALGYEKAAERADAPQLSQTFREKGNQRRQMAAQLNQEITRLGGSPRADGSFSGDAHRAFVGLVDAFGDSNENAVKRVEEGEDYIRGKFESALNDDELTLESRQLVQQCASQIQADERFADQLEGQYS